MSESRLAPRPTSETAVPGGDAAIPVRGRPGPVAHIGLFRAFWNFMRDPNATVAGPQIGNAGAHANPYSLPESGLQNF